MATRTDTSLWHPFSDMAAIRGNELVIERGEGVWLWDDQGNRYLDGSASLWYCNVGHGRAEIAGSTTELRPGDQVLAILEPGKEDELRRVLLKK